MGADVASGLARAYVAYVRQPGGTNERKSLRLVGSAWSTNARVLGSSVPPGRRMLSFVCLRVIDSIERSLKLYCDNKPTVLYAHNNKKTNVVKHINIKFYVMKEKN
jgi:hypothetical protein